MELPVYDHIVIVVEENKDWADIIGNGDAPYINMLASEGALFTQSFGLEHHSQGNYYWLFSGSNQGVGFIDEVPVPCEDRPDATYCTEGGGYPFTASNLGQQLIAKGLSFKGYSESLPEIGSTVPKTYYGDDPEHDPENPRILYARKHVPWISFSNVPNGTTVATSSNLRLADFPTDFSQLPTVSFVIPDLENDMHNLHDKPANCINKGSVCVGDAWLKENLDAYYQWAKANNSLLIFTFDEDNGMGHTGLTDPFYSLPDGTNCKEEHTNFEVAHPESGANESGAVSPTPCGLRNGIVTIFAGAYIVQGEYDEGLGITHVNILRTIEAMYGLPKSGAQQENAAAGGITDDDIVTDVFHRKAIQPPPTP
jgi:hypothetical protein